MHAELPQGIGAAFSCQSAPRLPSGGPAVYTMPLAPMKAPLSIRAGIGTLLAPNIAAFVMVELVLFALTRVASLLSLLAFAGLSLLAAAGFAAELLAWNARGIRCIDLDDEMLTVYRGPALAPCQVRRNAVRSVRIRSLLGRRTVELRMLTGKRLRIRGDAFLAAPFERFCAALAAWK